MIIEAILKINPNAEASVNAEDINQIIWHNGTKPIPKEQILKKIEELKVEYEQRIEQEKANKQSALNKLKALGLNDAEIKAIIG